MGVVMVATKEVGSLVRGEVFEAVHCGSLTGFSALEGVDCISVDDSSDVIPASAAMTIGSVISDNLQEDPHFILKDPKAKFRKGGKVQLLEIDWGGVPVLRDVDLSLLLSNLGLDLPSFRKRLREYKEESILLHKKKGKWVEVLSVTI